MRTWFVFERRKKIKKEKKTATKHVGTRAVARGDLRGKGRICYVVYSEVSDEIYLTRVNVINVSCYVTLTVA